LCLKLGPGMNKTITLLIAGLLMLMIPVAAQDNGVVKGKVKDKSGNSEIPGAIIFLNSNTGTATDINGDFILSVPAGNYTLTCTAIGYSNLNQAIEIKVNDTLNVLFSLSDANTMLEEVVVSAGKFEQKLSDVTVSMDVIKSQLIENKNSTTLDMIMNQVPGVTVSDGQASIRGGSGFAYGAGSRVLVLVDEMPMISADAGDVKWNYLPIENLEQVEVLKGASSALFGSSALNGVINLRTGYAKDKPETKVSTFYGSYDAPKYQYKWWKGSSQSQSGVNLSHAQKIGNLDLVIGAHMFDDEGYRMLETEHRSRMNVNLRYNFKKISGLSVGVNTNMMNVKGGLFFLWKNADSALVPNGIQNYKNKRFNIDPFVTYYFGNGNKLSYRGRYFQTLNTNDKNQESTAELGYNELQYQRRFKDDLNVNAGLVYMTQQIFSDSLYGRHFGENMAGYLQVDKKIKRLTASFGIRGERSKVDSAYTRGYVKLGRKEFKNLAFQPVIRLGLNYQAAKFTYFRASYGQGYRFPSVAEKFVSTSVDVLHIYPNPSLQPERGWSAEIGVKQGFKIGKFNGFLDVAAFWTEYTNNVEFIFGIYPPDSLKSENLDLFTKLKYAGFKCQNTGRAQIRGVEFTVSGAGKIGPVNVALFAGYTYLDPVNPDYDPSKDTLGLPYLNVLKYRNRHLIKGDVQLDYKFFFLGYSVRYQSYMENIDQQFMHSTLYYVDPNFDLIPFTYVLPGLPSYREKDRGGSWVHDIRVGFNINKNLKIAYIVNNLFNEEYSTRPGDVRPPRLHMFQLSLKF
jgi:outer membrane cobalamin receptor